MTTPANAVNSVDALARLAATIETRKPRHGGDPEASYVARLLHKGPDGFLKKIGEDAVIDKKISSHIARHTFASIAIKKSNGDINFVQNALKHSNAKITQVYLASLDNDSMDSKMNDVTSI